MNSMAAPRPKTFKPYFGGFLLETLTLGMYGESRNAIREYVQNSFDSIQRAIRELRIIAPADGLIRVIFDDDLKGLRIRDNGAGLPASLAAATLTSVGASRKDYATDAGFRGIGRLAGIVFSDTVTFLTKAAGEAEETTVTFNAKEMRRLMSPGKGSELTAEELLSACVTVTATDVPADAAPYFEVALRGFQEDAPSECTEPQNMVKFLAQVAPVPYSPDFPDRAPIHQHARRVGIPIDEMRLIIEQSGAGPIDVYKPFAKTYEVENAEDLVPLAGIQFYTGDSKRWWGWMGKKGVPGTYADATVRGLRVRAKNIQIDGIEVMAEIFQKRARSNARYQSWFIGEIFVDTRTLTPNARRDGFEDTKIWRSVAAEIANTVCKDAGSSAQEISNQGQLTLEKLTEKAAEQAEISERLRKDGYASIDKTIAFSADLTKLQGQVARASRNADTATLTELQHVGSRLVDMKVEAISKLTSVPAEDSEAIEHRARGELLSELLLLFKDQLEAACLARVRTLIREHYDWPPVAGL